MKNKNKLIREKPLNIYESTFNFRLALCSGGQVLKSIIYRI